LLRAANAETTQSKRYDRWRCKRRATLPDPTQYHTGSQTQPSHCSSYWIIAQPADSRAADCSQANGDQKHADREAVEVVTVVGNLHGHRQPCRQPNRRARDVSDEPAMGHAMVD